MISNADISDNICG